MAVTPYIYDGAVLGAAASQQGTAVPALTKRVIKSASLVNPSTAVAPVAATINLVTSDGSTIVHISDRPIAPGESYPCPELINKGMNPGGYVQAKGDGLTFMYTATDFV